MTIHSSFSHFKKPLFIFEMANNHMGELTHGLAIIDAFAPIAAEFPEFNCAIKFQYRDLDTFIHESAKGRQEIKLVKRFEETRLAADDFIAMTQHARSLGLRVICTPFDEVSVDRVVSENFDFLKIASCSLTDWPLIEHAVKSGLPMIVSTAGAIKEEVDRVFLFLQNRKAQFALMHCVAEYPTGSAHLHLARIGEMIRSYPQATIGYSTHEDPSATLPIAMAIASGARVFEKHVALPTDKYAANAYSATPAQVRDWLLSAREAFLIMGAASWPAPSTKELDSLRELRRGIWTSRDIKKGETIKANMVEFAFPPSKTQYLANDWSKYSVFTAQQDIPAGQAVSQENTLVVDTLDTLKNIAERVKSILTASNIHTPTAEPLEVSHHYGLGTFEKTGLAMITVVNREYCKKILVMLEGQEHPEQYHLKKEETFVMVHGKLMVYIDGQPITLGKGDVLTVKREQRHRFIALTDCVFEEISSTHDKNDSYYTDPSISSNLARKSFLNFWLTSHAK